jgi:hypothetical protein
LYPDIFCRNEFLSDIYGFITGIWAGRITIDKSGIKWRLVGIYVGLSPV